MSFSYQDICEEREGYEAKRVREIERKRGGTMEKIHELLSLPNRRAYFQGLMNTANMKSHFKLPS